MFTLQEKDRAKEEVIMYIINILIILEDNLVWTTSRSMWRHTFLGTLRPESATAASFTLLFGFFSESCLCCMKCSENIMGFLYKLFIIQVQNSDFFLTLLLSSFPVQLCKAKEASGNPQFSLVSGAASSPSSQQTLSWLSYVYILKDRTPLGNKIN